MKPMVNIFNWTVSDVSLSFPLIMSTAAAAAIPAGKALEYIKPRNLLLVGGFIFGGGVFCLGFTNSLAYLNIFAFISGVGLGTVYPGATVSNIVRLLPDRRGHGVRNFESRIWGRSSYLGTGFCQFDQYFRHYEQLKNTRYCLYYNNSSNVKTCDYFT